MSNSNFQLTQKVRRIFRAAQITAEENNNNILHPVHLLIGALGEKTGVLGEVNLKANLDKSSLIERLNKFSLSGEGKTSPFFNIEISESTENVINRSVEIMKRFNQIYLNEGHIIKALMTINDPAIEEVLLGMDKELILDITATARDMIVYLKDYSFPEIDINKETIIRRALESDKKRLINYIETEFGGDWSRNVENGFGKKKIPIFIALFNNKIIGFSAHDVVRKKKGIFGPIGISMEQRAKGTGIALLHYSLNDMKQNGYDYAILEDTGPIEFYEKACNAIVIPHKY